MLSIAASLVALAPPPPPPPPPPRAHASAISKDFPTPKFLASSSSSTRFPVQRAFLKSTFERLGQRSAGAGSECAYELQEGQSRTFHRLPSGLQMEVLVQLGCPDGGAGSVKAPIVFVHGSCHAAWCWAVHWLPYFASKGHDCFAISLLGQGESDVPSHAVAGTIQSHARDLAHFIRQKLRMAPILVGHSFGGLIIQLYLSHVSTMPSGLPAYECDGWAKPYPALAGAILACSVPPSGNGGLVVRYFLSKPLASLKVTISLAAKAFAYSLSLCKETFFSSGMPNLQVARYQQLLKKSSHVPLFDLRQLNASLPVPQASIHAPPILVVGAENDFILDFEALQETAAFYGTSARILPGMAHDIMLDMKWDIAASTIDCWLQDLEGNPE